MIKLLDCTLRDGGHIIDCHFGEEKIKRIVDALECGGCDIIELGFLRDDVARSEDDSVYANIEQTERYCSDKNGAEYALMVQRDQYDVRRLEEFDGRVEHIRVSFHTYDKKEGMECARIVKEKGYKVHINPINFSGYNTDEKKCLLEQINELNPYTFTIVDTFGSLLMWQLKYIYQLIENNLEKGIHVGLHFHENLASSFALAQFYVMLNEGRRPLSIDCSIDGMGKIPGNLPIELIMDFLNKYEGKSYNVTSLAQINEMFIRRIKEKSPWGYSLPYALSAQRNTHRSYAAYAVRVGMNLWGILNFLESIPEKERHLWNETVAKKAYESFMLRS